MAIGAFDPVAFLEFCEVAEYGGAGAAEIALESSDGGEAVEAPWRAIGAEDGEGDTGAEGEFGIAQVAEINLTPAGLHVG